MVVQTFAQPGAVPLNIQTSTARPILTAVNPPSCAQEWADSLNTLTAVAVDITYSTTSCAENMGWIGQTWEGNKQRFPFHDGRVCAALIIDTLSNLFDTVASLEGAAFDCFNNNQACGQAISSAAKEMLEGINALVAASDDCAVPGGTPPYIPDPDDGYDFPAQGFACWADIVTFVQRILKSSKLIDVALDACPLTAPTPTGGDDAAPQPTAVNGSAPAPTADGSAGNSSVPTPEAGSPDGSVPAPTADTPGVPTPTADGSTDTNSSLGASWSSLLESRPFSGIGSDDAAGVERRLSAHGATLRNAGHQQREDPGDSLAGAFKAFGAVSMPQV